ncbi:hypothetical protein N0V82_005374 [Gnomoniopsis sp. IMI 355080]|nr:hypothetical protein N0V82_005374 [Gnomoniopsis sp. IMI 355080]
MRSALDTLAKSRGHRPGLLQVDLGSYMLDNGVMLLRAELSHLNSSQRNEGRQLEAVNKSQISDSNIFQAPGRFPVDTKDNSYSGDLKELPAESKRVDHDNSVVSHSENVNDLAEKILEEKELPFFSKVQMARQTRMHDAALAGDCTVLSDMISKGHDVQRQAGPAGSVLNAAILSDNWQAVHMVLRVGGQDLLFSRGAMYGGPIEVAARYGSVIMVDKLLGWASTLADQNPSAFQVLLDRALFKDVDPGNLAKTAALLDAGANPLATTEGDQRSCFSVAWKRPAHQPNMVEVFVAAVWRRKLLSVEEADLILRTERGDEVEEEILESTGFGALIANLHIGRSDILEKLVQRRLSEVTLEDARVQYFQLLSRDQSATWRDFERSHAAYPGRVDGIFESMSDMPEPPSAAGHSDFEFRFDVTLYSTMIETDMTPAMPQKYPVANFTSDRVMFETAREMMPASPAMEPGT